MKQVLQIRCKNNKKTLEVPIGSTLYEVYRAFNLKMDFGPVSAKGQTRECCYPESNKV